MGSRYPDAHSRYIHHSQQATRLLREAHDVLGSADLYRPDIALKAASATVSRALEEAEKARKLEKALRLELRQSIRLYK